MSAKRDIRNLGFSFHAAVEVYDYLLASDIKVGFCAHSAQHYVDWKHASGFNVNADYLYGELVKKGIRALVMEPLLGGRLTKLSDSLVAVSKKGVRRQRGLLAFRFRDRRKRSVRVERHDLHGAPTRQHSHLFTTGTANRRRERLPRRNGADPAEIPTTLHRLQILHAVPVWNRHTNHIHALQQMREREGNKPKSQQDPFIVRRERPFGGLRQNGAPLATGQPPHRVANIQAPLSAKH